MDVENNFSAQLRDLRMDKQALGRHINTNTLLSIERVQKLDLLLHLITNLQNTLVLRGVSGIGKTTLLKSAFSQGIKDADVCLLNGLQTSSFEGVLNELLQFVGNSNDLIDPSLTDLLDRYAQQGRRLVLLVDDAGLLVSGLITSLNDFARQYSALRLVFALTPDEYLVKHKAENIGSYCHFIELPALSFSQCELFVRQLIQTEPTVYQVNDINVAFIQNIYRQTKGNPEEIRQFIKMAKRRPFNALSWLVVLVVVVIACSVFVSLFLWRESAEDLSIHPEKNKIAIRQIPVIDAEPAIVQEVEQEVILDTPALAVLKDQENTPVESVPLFQVEDVAENPELQAEDKLIEKLPVSTLNPELTSVIEKTDIVDGEGAIAETIKVDEKLSQVIRPVAAIQKVDDRQWLLRQDTNGYTLQLMVLTDKSKLLVEREKYKKIGYETFLVEKKGKKYVLFYGSFKTLQEAQNIMQKLPKELRQSWPRQFKVVQKEL